MPHGSTIIHMFQLMNRLKCLPPLCCDGKFSFLLSNWWHPLPGYVTIHGARARTFYHKSKIKIAQLGSQGVSNKTILKC